MRLLKINVYYPAYLRQFEAERPHLAELPYADQHHALMDDCFGSADFWTRALSALGRETCEVVANAEAMQKRWAAERGFVYPADDWLSSIAIEQIKAFRPDVLLVADFSTLSAQFLRRAKEACPTLRRTLIWCGAPYHDAAIFRECDAVLSCVPELIEGFRAGGHRPFHLNHAFEPRVLDCLYGESVATPATDFAFLGSIVKGARFHTEREKLLTELIARTNLQIWSDVCRRAATPAASFPPGSLMSLVKRAIGKVPLLRRAVREELFLAATQISPSIAARARPPLFGRRMFRQLRDSKISLNTHIDVSVRHASNLRLFEATGVGSCLLTDWKSNLGQLFADGEEVATYRTAGECAEKARYLLEHDETRRRIAEAGQRRTLRDHTYRRRAQQLDQILTELERE